MVGMGEARTEDRGSFTHGVCRACGWWGPARRARASAGRDLELHLGAGCPMQEAEYAGDGATGALPTHPLPDTSVTGDEATRVAASGRHADAEADGGSQAHGIPVALGEGGVAPGRERLTAHGRS